MKTKHLIHYPILYLILLTGAAGFFGSNPEADSGGSPVAVVAEGAYRFEPVPEGTPVTHEFKIQNTGTAPLRIERVNTG
jgi:hypothetical protein